LVSTPRRPRGLLFRIRPGASRSQLNASALQLALDGVEGDLKGEHANRCPADDSGASKDQERLHTELSNDGGAIPANGDAAVMVNFLPASRQCFGIDETPRQQPAAAHPPTNMR
jgi:hypothetical protein